MNIEPSRLLQLISVPSPGCAGPIGVTLLFSWIDFAADEEFSGLAEVVANLVWPGRPFNGEAILSSEETLLGLSELRV